ncbi:MAG: hypothetical protein WC459_01255 [Patescibacteria group bacterium]
MNQENNELNYEFAPTGNGEETGFNDSVTMMFRGNIYRSLAREPLQNIIDARIKCPAKAVFSLQKIKASKLPKADELKRIFKACKEYYSDTEYDCFQFFKNAEDAIADDKEIFFLKISDYNTKGLSGGDYDRDGNYYNFLKSSGASAKGNGGTGGSFGLGKGAYFANSSFRSIFVSSVFEGNKNVFQGKLRLVTHLKNNEIMQGNGTFGLKNQLPVRSFSDIPEIFRRKEQGTDIFIVGFEPEDNWKEKLAKAVLNNFWYSILKGILEVEIEEIKIAQNNIPKLMYQYFSEDEPDTNDNPNPLPYFNSYYDKDGHIDFEKEMPVLGTVRLYLLFKEGYPNKISYFRKTGMEIQRKKHLHFKSYAGVFICENEKGNAVLRGMENPSHEEWSKDNCRRVHGKVPGNCSLATKELKNFIQESLGKLFAENTSSALTIKGLEKYLNLPSLEETGLAASGFQSDAEIIKVIAASETGTEVGIADEERIKNLQIIKQIKIAKSWKINSDPKKGKNKKSPKKNKEKIKRFPIEAESRAFAIKHENGGIEHFLKIKNMPETECDIELLAGTDASFKSLKILEAINKNGQNYEIKKNLICRVRPDSNGDADLKIIFDDRGRYSLKVNIYKSL